MDARSDNGPRWVPGQRIRVVDGPLSGLRGIVTDFDSRLGRVTADFIIYGRTTPAEFDPNQVEIEL